MKMTTTMKTNRKYLPIFLLAAVLMTVVIQDAAALTSINAGDMVITSRLMTFENNIYVARGGIKAVQKETTLTADRGIYDRSLELVKAIDNVVVTQPTSVLKSDYLEAYVKEDRILAKGNPRLTRVVERESRTETGEKSKKKTRVILTCKEVEGFNKENRYVAKGDVHLVEVPYREGETEEEAKENEKDPVSDLVCENLEMFSSEDKAIARNNVVIVTKTLRATGDKAIYLDKENRLIIVGHAHAYQSSRESPGAQEQVSELFANKLIYYPNEDRTIAVGEVHATVYPKGQKGPEEKTDRKAKKKKKGSEEGVATASASITDKEKAEKESETATQDETTSQSSPQEAETPPENLPQGEYTPIGGEEPIQATSE